MRQVNRDGIRWWTDLLRQGRHIAAVGGSDFHRDCRPVRLGNPVTAVYAASRSSQDILTALAQGRSYITGQIHGVRLNLTCLGETFGSVISDCAASHILHIEAEKMPVGSVLQLVGQNGLLAKFHPRKGKVCTDLEIRRTSFVYLLALYPFPEPEGYPLAVSNPIYFA